MCCKPQWLDVVLGCSDHIDMYTWLCCKSRLLFCQQTCITRAFCEGSWWSALNTTGCASQYLLLGSALEPIKGLLTPYNHRNFEMVFAAVISRDAPLRKFC